MLDSDQRRKLVSVMLELKKQVEEEEEPNVRSEAREDESFMEQLLSAKSHLKAHEKTYHLKKLMEADDCLKKDSDSILKKLKFLTTTRGIDHSWIPQEVTDCLNLDHLAQVILRVAKKRQTGVEAKEDASDEAFIQENADKLPPEVARELSHKKRREVCTKIQELREKKSAAEVQSSDALKAKTTEDEAFITQHLHLVPREIAEMLDSAQRRKLVAVVLEVKKLKEEGKLKTQDEGEQENVDTKKKTGQESRTIKKTSDFDNMFKTMKRPLDKNLGLTNGSGTYLESLPIEFAMRHFFNSKKALVVGQILLKLKLPGGFKTLVPEKPYIPITDRDQDLLRENWVPMAVARVLDETEREQLLSALTQSGQGRHQQNKEYDVHNADMLSPVGLSEDEDGQIVVSQDSDDACNQGTFLERMDIAWWITHIPEAKREAVYDLFTLGMNTEGLAPVDPDMIPPLLVKAAGLKISHQLLASLSEKGDIAEMKKSQEDGKWSDFLMKSLAELMPRDQLSAVCGRLELLKKFRHSSITGSNPGVIPPVIADVLSTQEERQLIGQMLDQWAQDQINRLRTGKVHSPKSKVGAESKETNGEEKTEANGKEEETEDSKNTDDQHHTKRPYLCELPKKNILFLASSFSKEKQEVIHTTVMNLRIGLYDSQRSFAKRYHSQLKENSGLLTDQLVENVSPYLMDTICKDIQGLSKVSPKVHSIEDDIAYVEEHKDIIPKGVSKYFSPAMRRSIVDCAQLRQRMRKFEKLDEKDYILNLAAWIPREVAELLTPEEAKVLAFKLQEHKNIALQFASLAKANSSQDQEGKKESSQELSGGGVKA